MKTTSLVRLSGEQCQADHPTLFFFPHAGAGVSGYRSIAAQLPMHLRVFAICLPGREHRFTEKCHYHLTDAVAELVATLTPHLDKPFAFFGHSMGSLLAFECARNLDSTQRKNLRHLYLSGRRAPQIPPRNKLLSTLPIAEFKTEITALGGMDKSIAANQELFDLIVPCLQADLSLNETYQYLDGIQLDCPTTLLGGTDDVTTSVEDLAAWQQQFSQPIKLKTFNGNHFYLFDHEKKIVEIISMEL